MDEELKGLAYDADRSAISRPFRLEEGAAAQAERISSERDALAAMLTGDPDEHRRAWDVISAALDDNGEQTSVRASG